MAHGDERRAELRRHSKAILIAKIVALEEALGRRSAGLGELAQARDLLSEFTDAWPGQDDPNGGWPCRWCCAEAGPPRTPNDWDAHDKGCAWGEARRWLESTARDDLPEPEPPALPTAWEEALRC